MPLNTQIGSVKLRTPLLLASGQITETPEFFLRAQPYGCSGMVTRSLRQCINPERADVPVPRYAIFDGETMLNCEWGNGRPWTEWLNHGVGSVKNTGCPIIISLSGRDIDSCSNLIQAFDQISVDAYEINISCSHSGVLYGDLNINTQHLQQLMTKIRGITSTPIWIKLSYSSLLIQMAREAETLGANAIVCTNSIGPGMLIDIRSAKPMLGIRGGGGGLTGKAIFPIALWCVHQLSQTLAIPVVGCGGIFSADQAIQMFMAGASAVQLYTAPALKGPEIFRQITIGLKEFLVTNAPCTSIWDLIGLTSTTERGNSFSSPRPIIIEERCTGCGVCVNACAFGALELKGRQDKTKLAIIKDSCNSCNACVGVCPTRFNAIRASF